MKLLIIDDEYRARKGLAGQLEKLFPGVFEMETARSVSEGIDMISTFKPELVFLDIKMEDGSGFDLLQEIPRKTFELIFTTAYEEFALKAFDHRASSYLLKPISPKKLSVAVENAIAVIENQQALNMLEYMKQMLSEKGPLAFKFPVTNGLRFVNADDVIYVKAEGNYFQVFLETDDKPLLVSKSLKYFEQQMDHHFMRVHKSYIVNLMKIREFSRSSGGTLTLLNDYEVPLSSSYRNRFIKRVQGN
ncbi:MAG: LytR/AlgR family response regulator transcription factor [Owenweeksia sp.]